MPLTESQNQIDELIQQEIRLSEQLLEFLQSEYQALSTNNLDVIPQIAQDKQQIVDTLASLDRQRELLLQQAGFDFDKNGMKDFLKQCDSLLNREWQRLMTVISRCQYQNEINGIIINASSRNAKNMLSILKGQQPGDKVNYGPKGETINDGHTHPLAKA